MVSPVCGKVNDSWIYLHEKSTCYSKCFFLTGAQGLEFLKFFILRTKMRFLVNCIRNISLFREEKYHGVHCVSFS